MGRNANFLLGTAETQLAQCLSASVIIATTHNFDVSTIVSLVRCAARLPAVTHLVLGESRLCTPRCKAICGPCCCFEPLGTEDIPTYWGNSCLSFTVYRRVVPWMLEVNEVPRVIDEATLAALHAGELDPQIRQMGAGAAEARAMAGAGAGVRAAAVALHGVGLPGAAGDAAGGGGGERGVHSGERRPRAVGHASYEAVRMAAAKLQRNVHPPEKFSDHDMKVRRHKYPSRAERKAKDALDSYYEWEPEDDAADAGDGGPALTSALEVPNSKSTTGIVGRLLKLVGVQEA